MQFISTLHNDNCRYKSEIKIPRDAFETKISSNIATHIEYCKRFKKFFNLHTLGCRGDGKVNIQKGIKVYGRKEGKIKKKKN